MSNNCEQNKQVLGLQDVEQVLRVSGVKEVQALVKALEVAQPHLEAIAEREPWAATLLRSVREVVRA